MKASRPVPTIIGICCGVAGAALTWVALRRALPAPQVILVAAAMSGLLAVVVTWVLDAGEARP